MAPTVTAPAFDAVGATPRALLDDGHFVGGRAERQKFAVHGDARLAALLNVVQGVGQRHFAVTMMMPVRFAVGRNMGQAGTITVRRECAEQGVGERFAVVEEPLESDSL